MNLRVKVPGEVALTEKAAEFLIDAPLLQEKLERLIRKYLCYRRYAEGELEERCAEMVLGVVNGAKKIKEAAEELYGEAEEYVLEGIEPLKIAVGVKGEAGAGVFLDKTENFDKICESFENLVKKEIDSRTKGYFTMSGIWSIGKSAILGKKTNLLERALYLAANENWEGAVSVLSIITLADISPTVSGIRVISKIESGRYFLDEYRAVNGGSFVENLKYALLLYLCLEKHDLSENTSEDSPGTEEAVGDRKKAAFIAVFLMGRLDCGQENSVRAVLNLLCYEILSEMGAERSKQVVFLMEAARTIESIGAPRCENAAKYALALSARAKEICTQREIYVEILAQIVRTKTAVREASEEVEELVKYREWAKYFEVVKEYSEKLWFSSGLKRDLICNIEIDLRCRKIFRKRRRGGGEAKKDAEAGKDRATERAHTEYVRDAVSFGDTLLSGQRIEIEAVLKGVKVDEAVIVADGKEYALSTSLRRKITVRNSAGSSDPQKEVREMSFKEIRLRAGGFFFSAPLGVSIKVSSRRYTAPAVKYRAISGKFGLTPIFLRGCTPCSKGVFGDTASSLSEWKKGLKKSLVTRFYVRDALGSLILVRTPHRYTEERKPRISRLKVRGRKARFEIEGSKKISADRKWKIDKKDKKVKITAKFKTRKTKETEDDQIPASAPPSPPSPLEDAICKLLLFEERATERSAIEMAIQDRFYKDDQVVREIRKFRKTDVLPYLPVRAGRDPILIVKTKHNTVITRIPVERAITSNPHALWSAWTKIQQIIRNCIFHSHALKLEKILRLLKEATDTSANRSWCTSGCLVQAQKKESKTKIKITNFSYFGHFIVVIGMKISYLKPKEHLSYLTETPQESLSVNIARIE